MNNFKITTVALSVVAAAVLVACGGGGSSPATATAQNVAVQTFIVDNLATEYSQVFVSVKKVTALDSTGASVTLLDATAAPVVINLSSLASVAQLMSTVTIPAGVYHDITVTLDNAVKLVSLDGKTTTNAQFSLTPGDFVWTVHGVDADTATGQFVLDFNLNKFTVAVDAATGVSVVTPVVELPKTLDKTKFKENRGEVHGTVVSTDTTKNTITINDARLGNGIVATLTTDAVITNEATNTVITLAAVTLGMNIEIKGTVTPGATAADPVTISATNIEVEPAKAVNTAPLRGEGTVTAVSGSLVTISLLDANFLPSSNALKLDVTSAKFGHGVLADVVVGATVGFRGASAAAGSGADVTVVSLDVRGAQSAHDRDMHPGLNLAAMIGSVTVLNADGSFTLNASKVMGGGTPAAQPGPYTVDVTNAIYLGSSASAACMKVGATVDVVGTLTATTLAAKVVGVDGCGGMPKTH